MKWPWDVSVLSCAVWAAAEKAPRSRQCNAWTKPLESVSIGFLGSQFLCQSLSNEAARPLCACVMQKPMSNEQCRGTERIHRFEKFQRIHGTDRDADKHPTRAWFDGCNVFVGYSGRRWSLRGKPATRTLKTLPDKTFLCDRTGWPDLGESNSAARLQRSLFSAASGLEQILLWC